MSTNNQFDEIIDLLKTQNIQGDEKNITLGVVDVPIEKQIAIDKVKIIKIFVQMTNSMLQLLVT